MKRVMLIAGITGLLSMPAFAQVNPSNTETEDQRQVLPEVAQAQLQTSQQVQAQQNQAQQNQGQQVQRQITDLYIADFKSEVQLSDEQFIKLNPGIRNFMQLQFENARRRQAFRQQLNQLMDQPDPSEADVTQLIEAKNQFEREAATLETRFLTRIGAELTPQQRLWVMDFNRKFMDEKLPGLIQQARDRTANNPAARNRNAQQQQQPPQVSRPNANRPNGQARPGAALRGRNQK